VPDVILSDVLMPDMDGFLFCQAVRADSRLAHVPVVLLSSAYVDDADRALARQMGASALLVRTPDLDGAIAALEKASPPVGPTTTPARGDLALLHKERVQVQLVRQVARNDALQRQGAIQGAALSVVRGLAEALAHPRDLASVLGDVLVHCLDASGLSTGLLYLASGDGKLRLSAQAGLSAEARAAAAAGFGHLEVLRRALDGGQPIAFFSGSSRDADPGLEELARSLGQASALVIPFVVAGERVGVLLLAADSLDLSEPGWLAFAGTLAVQFGQTIAVGQSLFRGASSEVRYHTLMERANDAILLLDEHGIVEANQQAEALLGRGRADMIGRRYEDFVVPPEGAAGPSLPFGEGTTRVADQLLWRPDGSRVSVDVSSSPVRIGEDTIVLLILRDITERKRAETRLLESEEQYRLLFEDNPHPMWVHDPDTLGFLAVNEAAVRFYGYSRDEFPAMTVDDIRPPEEIPRLIAHAEGYRDAGPTSGVWKHRTKRGALADVEITASSIVFRGRKARLVLVTDVSERKRLESQLLQAQKMEAVGRLAGGVAHDFNNLLGVITGYSTLLRKALEPNHPGQKRVDEIEKAADRAAALTRQLLAFSRKQVLETKVLNLNEIVVDVENMLRRLIGEDVRMVARTAADLGRVRADRGQIEQVLINLAVNARDAMPEGGDLFIETSNDTLDLAYARIHAEVQPGRYVRLAVSDTGQGMDAETQSHVFEPFFTTKEAGKGTGLGLATVFGIVKQSGGHIAVYSEVGVGSTFTVHLPRVDEEAAEEAPASAAVPVAEGDATILLVEDAEALRVMIREILESANYSVLECSDAQDAIARMASDERRPQLLLTDVIMPRMSGPELARTLSASQPGLKLLFMSGYTDDAIRHRGLLESGAQFIQKPFTADSLLQKVRSSLEGQPASDHGSAERPRLD
jgi:PAS domain S-box-containing protein